MMNDEMNSGEGAISLDATYTETTDRLSRTGFHIEARRGVRFQTHICASLQTLQRRTFVTHCQPDDGFPFHVRISCEKRRVVSWF